MTDDDVMRRLRAARPPANEPADRVAGFQQTIAEPGDPRLLDTSAPRTSRLRGVTTRSGTSRRLLAGGTLGLAGIAAAVVLAVGAGGATAPPAFAITRHADGSIVVRLTDVSAITAAENQLAAMGVHEWFEAPIMRGDATRPGSIDCTPGPSPNSAAGQSVAGAIPSDSTPAADGPPVKLLLGSDGTSTVPVGQAGAGSWHLFACYLYQGAFPGVGNTGDTGAS